MKNDSIGEIGEIRRKNGITTLADMKAGERAVVKELSDGGRNIAERLSDLGFDCGEEILCTIKSMLGDPSAFLVRGSVIALRRADASCVRVEII